MQTNDRYKLSDFEVHIGEKPNNRVVYTISIFADYYLDINVIERSYQNEQRSDNNCLRLLD